MKSLGIGCGSNCCLCALFSPLGDPGARGFVVVLMLNLDWGKDLNNKFSVCLHFGERGWFDWYSFMSMRQVYRCSLWYLVETGSCLFEGPLWFDWTHISLMVSCSGEEERFSAFVGCRRSFYYDDQLVCKSLQWAHMIFNFFWIFSELQGKDVAGGWALVDKCSSSCSGPVVLFIQTLLAGGISYIIILELSLRWFMVCLLVPHLGGYHIIVYFLCLECRGWKIQYVGKFILNGYVVVFGAYGLMVLEFSEDQILISCSIVMLLQFWNAAHSWRDGLECVWSFVECIYAHLRTTYFFFLIRVKVRPTAGWNLQGRHL